MRKNRKKLSRGFESLEHRILFSGTPLTPEQGYFDSLGDGIIDLGSAATDAIVSGVQQTGEFLETAYDTSAEIVNNVAQKGAELVNDAVDTIAEVGNDVQATIEETLGIDIEGAVDRVLGRIGIGGDGFGEGFGEIAEGLVNHLTDFLDDVGRSISDHTSDLLSKGQDVLDDSPKYVATIGENLYNFDAGDAWDLGIGAASAAAEIVNLGRDAYTSLSEYYGPEFNATIMSTGFGPSLSFVAQPILEEHDSFGVTPFTLAEFWEETVFGDNAEAAKRRNASDYRSMTGRALEHSFVHQDNSLGDAYRDVMIMTTLYVVPHTGIPLMAADAIQGVHDDNFEQTGAAGLGLYGHVTSIRNQGPKGNGRGVSEGAPVEGPGRSSGASGSTRW